MEQFITLARIKTFMNIAADDTLSDAVLTSLIEQVSGEILTYCNRPTFLLTTEEMYVNGSGTISITLPEWPVLAVTSLAVDGRPISPGNSNPNNPGYRFDRWNGRPSGQPQKLYLTSYTFTKGIQNVSLTYQYGYAVQNEKRNAATTVTALQQYGHMSRNDGVLDNDLAPMTLVTGAPGIGEYAVAEGTGVYTFNAGQTGSVYLSYSYVPSPIEKACQDMVARRYRERSRVGQRTQSQGGEISNTYDLAAMPEDIKMVINSYRKVWATC